MTVGTTGATPVGKVLILHNRYSSASPSGENGAVDQDVRDLQGVGVEVAAFAPSSDSLRSRREQVRAAVGLPHNRQAAVAVRRLLATRHPDIAHLHNPYPLLTTSVIRAVKAAGVPLVQTLHNYRHGCMRGDHFRESQLCLACAESRSDWPGVRHGCYRGSRPESAVFAYARWRSAEAWRLVDGFIVLNDFMRDYAVDVLGVPRDRLYVRPTTVAAPALACSDARRGFLYAGRLSDEKGIRELLAAWARPGEHRAEVLSIAGDGHLRADVQRAASVDGTINYLGLLDAKALGDVVGRSRAVVVPSRWYEGFPRIIAEALASGTPVIAFDIGSLAAIVPRDCGWVVEQSIEALARSLDAATVSDLQAMSHSARQHYERFLTPERGISRLLEIYEAVRERAARC